MKRVFVADGKIYVKDNAKKTSDEKALNDKIHKLESKIDELLKDSSPEEKERQVLMKRLSAVRHSSNNISIIRVGGTFYYL